MASFLRGKQAGIEGDLSAGITGDIFAIDDLIHYGIGSLASAIAYDPIQSLLAIGTSDTQYGPGSISIFGQSRVSQTFTLPRKASVRSLYFAADKLVSLDSGNDICVYSLEDRKKLHNFSPPGTATKVAVDPALDYIFIGMSNGEVVAYDMDRGTMTPFRLPNFWLEKNPRARVMPVVALSLHPRDVGTLLIGYPEGLVLYSFKRNQPKLFCQYEIPKGAPGGDADPNRINEARRPRLVQATWHPTGTFVVTAHDDSSLVFWDTKDGRVVMARTIEDVNVNIVGAGNAARPGTLDVKEPIAQLAWCAKENPDDTGLLITGGNPTNVNARGLTFLDFGPTPNYQTSSWQILSKHFESPKRQTVLPTPPNADVVSFCLIPRSSPHFAGAQDPIALTALLSSGELVTMSFPSGHPISPTNQHHVSTSFVHPFITKAQVAYIDRQKWANMKEYRSQGPKFLNGGAESRKPMKRFEGRNIVTAAHADGTVRLWDTGHADEIENTSTIQIDLGRAVGRWDDIDVTQMSLSGASNEMSIGLRTGEVVVFRQGLNQNLGRDVPIGSHPNNGAGQITDIRERTDPGLKEGLLPFTLFNEEQGPVTALKHSDVGFIAAGYESGAFVIVDLRGPAIIHKSHLSDFAKGNKRSSLIRKDSGLSGRPEWIEAIEFGVMSCEGDDYSSILCFIGTNLGRFATFKILPSSDGTYSAALAGAPSNLDDRILHITTINAATGETASASQNAVAQLRHGYRVNGSVVAITTGGCRIFKAPSSKGAHKSWDDYLCESAGIVNFAGRGYGLVGLFNDGQARLFSLPSLKELGCRSVRRLLDEKRLGEASVMPCGDIVGWTGPSELAVLSVWGSGLGLQPSEDLLFNPQATIPPRPTISNLQWISGTQYITPADLDLLVAGPNRPPSKRMLAQMRADEAAAAAAGVPQAGGSGSNETYWAYMQRQVAERTEKLNLMGDNMDRLEENSSGFVDDVNRFVGKQKKKAALGMLGSKFGF